MSGQYSNPPIRINWSIDTVQDFQDVYGIEKPDFENPVDDIVWTLEHENDPKPLDRNELGRRVAEAVAKEIDEEIINGILKAIK